MSALEQARDSRPMWRLHSRAFALALVGIGSVCLSSAIAVPRNLDPLPSWNDGVAKDRIIAFVERVTTPGNVDYVPPDDRIATFDNDGTLWVEKPFPVEVYFMLNRLNDLARQNLTVSAQQPFKAALNADPGYFHTAGVEQSVIDLVVKTKTEMSQERYMAEARLFLSAAFNPSRREQFIQLAYQPMLELLVYLRANGFQTWLCSGGSTDFMRAFAPKLYGIPASQTIGTDVDREYRDMGGMRLIWRLPHTRPVNDRAMKPVNIDGAIGRRPLLAAGNVGSGGDVDMLDYSRGRPGLTLQILVHHDDAEREFAYGELDSLSLRAAVRNGYTVVSMKHDWRTIFPR
jgi:phosphoserine phosphatase